LRVIAGSAKGTRLTRVPPGTRPLSDRAREGLFSSLGETVVDAAVADLYAGTGACGIEALSRGAAACTFVDSSASAVKAIDDNLERTRMGDRARVVRGEVARFLERERGPFDIAILDPPYDIDESALTTALGLLVDRLVPNGVFALTRPAPGDATDVIPIHWRAAKFLRYGDARILVCRRQP
jgi:16S rRNA (guanine966-N2)-methyltransferase